MFVRTRGLFSRFADYSYSLDKADFLHYGLEQQATIASDYWLIQAFGINRDTYVLVKYRNLNPNESIHSILSIYKSVMKGFPG
jgi:hypothetical protein